MNLVKEKQGRLVPTGLEKMPFKLIKHLADTTRVSRSTAGCCPLKVSKGEKIWNRYNQVPQLTQDANGRVINSQLDTINENQEGSPFPAGDHTAHINRRAQKQSKHKTEKHKRSTKEVPPWYGQ